MDMKSLNGLNIKIYADGANLEQIKIFNNDPLIKGFTTNPTLMKNQGIEDYEGFAKELLNIVNKKPISFEIFADESDQIIEQAKYISSWASNVYVKVPVTNTKGEFLGDAISKLSEDEVKLNITAVFTDKQVEKIINVLNKNTHNIISIFSGRIADAGIDPVKHFRSCLDLKNDSNLDFLWASPRELFNIFHAEEAGADIITISQDLIKKFEIIGKDLNLFSKETVEMFYNDALTAGYKLDINQ